MSPSRSSRHVHCSLVKNTHGQNLSRCPAQAQDVLDAEFPANWVRFSGQATASNLDSSRAVEDVSKEIGTRSR
ncbi:hypothetical protein CORC01_12498 [Colletotrichum orchidophilum]|uniref:Uncharacterized protein n=1 Tax=Colletotrichum orchidophilum TaxID=1209926 RepID=A0A1G4ASR6_9PEZI|nr:uncharacterized protein CORC01_12498 [Colletotrichum orchidophilum]OHE92204.1 hypothetical protein CORC01_12498 [Colletotrichum orchidophilum]